MKTEYRHQSYSLGFTITDLAEIEPTRWQRTKAKVRRFFGLRVPRECMTVAEREEAFKLLRQAVADFQEWALMNILLAGANTDNTSRAAWERTMDRGLANLENI